MLRTNSNKFKDKVFTYIVDVTEGHFLDAEIETEYNEKTAAEFIYNAFKAEYNCEYCQKCYPNTQRRISEWLQGLGLPVACGEYECAEVMADWQETEHAKAEKTLQRWNGKKGFNFTGFCNLLAYFILKLWEKHGLNIYALNTYKRGL